MTFYEDLVMQTQANYSRYASYVISNNGSCIPTLDVADRIACR